MSGGVCAQEECSRWAGDGGCPCAVLDVDPDVARDESSAVQVVAATDGYGWWCMSCDAEDRPFRTVEEARRDGRDHECGDGYGSGSGDEEDLTCTTS